MSETDIEKGYDWLAKLREQLENSQVGILCLTPENLENRWVLYETGALSKLTDEARVIPFLFDLELRQIGPPYSIFQAATATKAGTKELVFTINKNLEDDKRVDSILVEASFEKFWPDLSSQLSEIGDAPEGTATPQRPLEVIAEETLSEVRALSRSVRILQGSLRSDTFSEYLLRNPFSSGTRRFTAGTYRLADGSIVEVTAPISFEGIEGERDTPPDDGSNYVDRDRD
ncbi:MAG: toll/interleukin-1 receptor domain-containing protein [Chloroflexi bacterium]|nr:toll/interleukin-1 receptor domain-containing protein [Chloroflexota bacterium]